MHGSNLSNRYDRHDDTVITAIFRIGGTVQGVGFRPFVYRCARLHGLTGFVCNEGAGVLIHVQGDIQAIERLTIDLQSPPPLAVISRFERDFVEDSVGYPSFIITQSLTGSRVLVDIAPDVAPCDTCLHELFDPANRRFHHPFINCTDCGPRYSIIKAMPYDRSQTTMSVFEMCPDCTQEYHDPLNRRFHAQPVCCPKCGPQLSLLDFESGLQCSGNPVERCRDLLAAGQIVAIKGIGGFHLACRADSALAVDRLRLRKKRETKPFAVMAASVDVCEKYAQICESDRKLLVDPARPIVLVSNRETAPYIAPGETPGLKTLGIMLPSSPLHYLLFQKACYDLLIMTSANISDEPMICDNQIAIQQLQGIADYILFHDRSIHQRVDDSIVRSFSVGALILRRARGFAPEPLPAPTDITGVAGSGGIQKSTVALGRADSCYVSPYLGVFDTIESMDEASKNLDALSRLLDVKPFCIAADLHPQSLGRIWAGQTGLPVELIQHHYAHAAACMAENRIGSPCIHLIFDGMGYGDDNAIWGGEILIADFLGYKRVGHLSYMPLPGGDAATNFPQRLACAALWKRMGITCFDIFPSMSSIEKEALGKLLSGSNPLIQTSSMGRLFDAASALLGLCDTRGFEGRPAMLLESIADLTEQSCYAGRIETIDTMIIIDGPEVLMSMIVDMHDNVSVPIIAARFHNTVAELSAQCASAISIKNNIRQVCLSGGCFQNSMLLKRTVAALKKYNLIPVLHRLVSPNDESISYGQVVIAAMRNKK